MRKLIWFLILVIFPIAGYSQQSHKCLSNDQTPEEIIKACTSGINDPKVAKTDQAWFAIRAGHISKFDKKDASTVIGFFLIAVEKGRLDGYARIGDLYREGYGSIKIDYKRANDYYDLDTTDSSTKLRGLATMLYEGKGVPQNVERALLLFSWSLHKSNDGGDASVLCHLFKDHKNPLRNLIIAHAYCQVAVKLEEDPFMKGIYENNRIAIAGQLDSGQLKQSKERFEQCVKEDYGLLCLIPVPKSKTLCLGMANC